MKKILILSLVILSLASCKEETARKSEPTTVPVEKAKENKVSPSSECYVYNANGSKIELQMNTNNSEVSGTLTYELKEKDSNQGTFIGTIKDSILTAQYTFQSEGSESVREVAFLIKNNQLIEGYGEVIVEGNTTTFKDLKTLKFTSNMPLTKTSCVVE